MPSAAVRTKSSVDISTTYMGLRLSNPFMAGASPLSAHLDGVTRLEDAGAGAIVLHSLFEEQTQRRASLERHGDGNRRNWIRCRD
jgi:dihydroorotate dehydrogenase